MPESVNRRLMPESDLICAFATAEGLAALAVLRISGQGAAKLADKLFRFGPLRKSKDAGSAKKLSANAVSTNALSPYTISSPPKRTVSSLKGYQAAYGHIVDPSTYDLVDEVVLLRYKAPHSYTGEEMIEISCHGGAVSKQKLLKACLHAGCRLATAGEFSKRAFLNGKFSLVEAEGLADLLNAEADEAQTLALKQLAGDLGMEFHKLQTALLDFEAKCQMGIEFPEYPEYDLSYKEYTERLEAIQVLLANLLASYKQGRIIKEGLKIALLGAPNAGKSSLLNALVKEDKAIVTNIPGTTRDVLEAEVSYKGLLCQYCDTAGIRKDADIVEKEGIKRSFKTAMEADVVLWLIDSLPQLQDSMLHEEGGISQALDSLPQTQGNLKVGILPTKEFLKDLAAKGIALFFVVTKSDLAKHEELLQKVKDLYATKYQVLSCSALDKEAVLRVQAQIYDYYLSLGKGKQQAVRISSLRQYQGLYNIQNILAALTNDYQTILPPLDILDQMLQACVEELELLTGDRADAAVIDTIFSKFCVGK